MTTQDPDYAHPQGISYATPDADKRPTLSRPVDTYCYTCRRVVTAEQESGPGTPYRCPKGHVPWEMPKRTGHPRRWEWEE